MKPGRGGAGPVCRNSPPAGSGLCIHTVGHSTRSLEELVELLRGHGVDLLIDIRTVPRSRRNPQFNRETLGESLRALEDRIGYLHLSELGGLRRGRGEGSPNTGWQNTSFRAFADYMLTEPFAAGLGRLLELAQRHRPAILCAEAVPWRCHRSLVADALLVRGMPVFHIQSARRCSPHRLTPFARVEGGRLTYPAGEGRSPG